jgi:hypothetical protein
MRLGFEFRASHLQSSVALLLKSHFESILLWLFWR